MDRQTDDDRQNVIRREVFSFLRGGWTKRKKFKFKLKKFNK